MCVSTTTNYYYYYYYYYHHHQVRVMTVALAIHQFFEVRGQTHHWLLPHFLTLLL